MIGLRVPRAVRQGFVALTGDGRCPCEKVWKSRKRVPKKSTLGEGCKGVEVPASVSRVLYALSRMSVRRCLQVGAQTVLVVVE
jgi:hypothetical protein